MKPCIFCRIVKGEVKGNVVYEDKNILAFLDANPISKGHTLIIPKIHYKDIYEIPENELKSIILLSKKLAKFYKKYLEAEGINIFHASGENSQQSVFHFHIHLVPRYKDDGLDTWPKSNYIENNFADVINKILSGLK